MGSEKYCWSRLGEHYNGNFGSKEEAIAEVLNITQEGETFFIGKCYPPIQPENLFDVEDFLNNVSCHEEYSLDCAENWDESSPEQRKELEKEVGVVIGAWLDRHELRPRFFLVDTVGEFVKKDGEAVPCDK